MTRYTNNRNPNENRFRKIEKEGRSKGRRVKGLEDRVDVAELKTSYLDPTTQVLLSAEATTRATNDTTISDSITTQINAVIDAAPGALNTLNELAAALNDDADFNGTITTLINTKRNNSDSYTITQIDDANTTQTTAISANATAISSNEDDIDAVELILGTRTATNLASLDTTSALSTQLLSKGTLSQQNTNTTAIAANLASIDSNDVDIALRATIDGPTFTGTVAGINKTMVGLGNVNNVASLSTTQAATVTDALDARLDIAEAKTSFTDPTTQTLLTAETTARTNADTTLTSAVSLNTAKTGISSGQTLAITTNTAKTGISSSQTLAITTNTAKTGISSGQTLAITTNTAKTGISSGQTLAITANTAKTGISSGQASAITANTDKTGISSGQTSAITTNTAKTGITSGQASAITANTDKTGISSGQTSAITANTAKRDNSAVDTLLDTKEDTIGSSTQLSLQKVIITNSSVSVGEILTINNNVSNQYTSTINTGAYGVRILSNTSVSTIPLFYINNNNKADTVFRVNGDGTTQASLTSNSTAFTQSSSNNSTAIATTAYVDAAGGFDATADITFTGQTIFNKPINRGSTSLTTQYDFDAANTSQILSKDVAMYIYEPTPTDDKSYFYLPSNATIGTRISFYTKSEGNATKNECQMGCETLGDKIYQKGGASNLDGMDASGDRISSTSNSIKIKANDKKFFTCIGKPSTSTAYWTV